MELFGAQYESSTQPDGSQFSSVNSGAAYTPSNWHAEDSAAIDRFTTIGSHCVKYSNHRKIPSRMLSAGYDSQRRSVFGFPMYSVRIIGRNRRHPRNSVDLHRLRIANLDAARSVAADCFLSP
jgi:hypothetical protein